MKGQTIIYKALHRKLKSEKQSRTGVNSCVLKGSAVSSISRSNLLDLPFNIKR